MSARRLPSGGIGPRFPGFDVLAQLPHWDDATRAVVLDRMHALPAVRFFTLDEEATATCLLDRLVGQPAQPERQGAPGEDPVDLVRMVDQRLAEDETDGWNYDTMPPDGEAWRQTLAALDEDALTSCGRAFADCDEQQQERLLERIRSDTTPLWHELPRTAVWSLWTRYAATAFYAHPLAWNEIGFPGPAYPRGYKALGIDKREPFEVADALPDDDPVHRRGAPS